MPLLPVALYGLEVPAGDVITPAVPDFPATFRITMAAIDPSASVEVEQAKRATLKLIRQPIGAGNEDDSEEDSDEEAYMNALLAGADSDDESEEEEEANGGPSDPAKSKKARKAAALEELLSSLDNDEDEDEDEEMEDVPNGVNGVKKSDKKGKSKATDEEDDESKENDSEEADEEDLEIEEFVICTLDPEKLYQQPLDITIGEEERVFFKVSGGYAIHLTGNYVIPDGRHDGDYESDEEDEEDEYDLSPDEHELMLGVDEESDDLDGLEDPRVTEVESEEEAPKLVSKAQKKQEKKGKNKRAADALDEAETLDDLIAKAAKPTETATNGEQKLSKKQLKKLKNNSGEAVPTKADGSNQTEHAKDVSQASKSDKKVKFAKELEQGPSGSSDSVTKGRPETQGKEGTKKAALGVKTVQGVKIDDREIGSGPAAKKGDRVGMRYIGKLTDGKVFDSNKNGKPFSFKLGVGEVVKGWDIGVAGMSVGGQRRLTIPANLAYGNKSLPGIPPNSTLVFDIKLLQIS